MTDSERLLDTHEMAERCKLSTVTLKRYRQRGVGPRWIRLPGVREARSDTQNPKRWPSCTGT